MKLWLDTETFSATPIAHGTYRYVDDSELMVVAWAVDDGPVIVEDLTQCSPSAALQLAMVEADEVWAHNAMFDRGVIAKHFTQIAPPLEKWRCTMVKALSHSLPGGLDKLCEILQVPQEQAKIKAGKELVRLFCQPRPANVKIRRATRATHPVEWARFLEYAGADILAMRQVDKRLPAWNYKDAELALWHLDQRINDRGFAVDLELAEAAVKAIDVEQTRLAGAAWAHSDGALNAATQRDAMLEHLLAEYHIALPDLRSSTLEKRLADPDIPEGMKELLRIRLQASTTSTSKYKALSRGATGGRLRGTLQFNGAGRTGRWAGRTFQPQNLPRPSMESSEIEDGIAALKAGAADLVFDNIMELCSNALRGTIVSAAGRKLCVADLSNIEGRTLAWLAGEEWKLQAFREFDAGCGPDLYIQTYAKTFRVRPEDVTKAMRQIGKVMELAFGYGGGVGAWVTFALLYGVDLEELGELAYDIIPDHVLRDAGGFYDWTVQQKRPTFGLSRRAFVVCDALKRMWRAAHLNVESLWRELEQACIDAVATPATTMTCRRFKVRRDGSWLRIGLPSGRRALCYPMPKVEGGQLTYMGVSQYTRQWTRLKTYGGKLVENVTQAVARDVLVDPADRVEDAGYQIVLSVHDELLTETPDTDDFSHTALADLMATPPTWAPDLPLAAAGFETYRYRKD